MAKTKYLYWDSCVFIAYFSDEPDRANTIEAKLAEVRRSNGQLKIVTSIYTRAEVAYVAGERPYLREDAPETLDRFWNDSSVISFVEVHELIAIRARDLMRAATGRGWSLRPPDAIHLASAEWIRVSECNTFDDRLWKYSDMIGLSVCAPIAEQSLLF